MTNKTDKNRKMQKSKNLNEIRVGTDELNSLIEEAIDEAIMETKGEPLNIDEFEVSSSRNNEDNCFDVEITIYGFAGTPSYEEFLQHEKVEEFSIYREDIGEIEFKLDEERSTILNSNDYLICYKSC